MNTLGSKGVQALRALHFPDVANALQEDYAALRAIADAAQWMRDCRDVDGLEDQYEAALDATCLAVERWEALRA